jgi:hypothetical protein
MQRPLQVSVVMSVLNGEKFLPEAVDSILKQSFRDFEFIVIDDGSTDSSGAILESYQKKDPRVRVYHQENRGLVESLNRGCAMARGKYLARMDADDIAIKERLMLQVRFMEEHPEVAVLGGAVEVIDSTGRWLDTSVNPSGDSQLKLDALRGNCPFWHSTVLMRKDVFVSVGGYRKVVVDCEDYDLWLRISDRYQLANLKEVLTKYRLHPDQVTLRKCKQGALSALAAQAAAGSRRSGNPDPLDSIDEITPAVLATLGVSDATLNATLAKRYLRVIQIMCDACQYTAATEALDEITGSCDWKLAGSRALAEVCLLRARLTWRQGRYLSSILNVGQAIIARPIVLGLPLKPLLRRVKLYGPRLPAISI